MIYNKITYVYGLLLFNFLQLLKRASLTEEEFIKKAGIKKHKCLYLLVFLNKE